MLVAIPNQAPKGEGVETRRAESKGSSFLWLRDSPAHKHSYRNGSENYSVMNPEVAGSNPAGVATTSYESKKATFTYNLPLVFSANKHSRLVVTMQNIKSRKIISFQ